MPLGLIWVCNWRWTRRRLRPTPQMADSTKADLRTATASTRLRWEKAGGGHCLLRGLPACRQWPIPMVDRVARPLVAYSLPNPQKYLIFLISRKHC